MLLQLMCCSFRVLPSVLTTNPQRNGCNWIVCNLTSYRVTPKQLQLDAMQYKNSDEVAHPLVCLPRNLFKNHCELLTCQHRASNAPTFSSTTSTIKNTSMAIPTDPITQEARFLSAWQLEYDLPGGSPQEAVAREHGIVDAEELALFERYKSKNHAQILEQKLIRLDEDIMDGLMMDSIKACDMLDGLILPMEAYSINLWYPPRPEAAFAESSYPRVYPPQPEEKSDDSSMSSPCMYSPQPKDESVHGSMDSASVYMSSDHISAVRTPRGRRSRRRATFVSGPSPPTRQRLRSPPPAQETHKQEGKRGSSNLPNPTHARARPQQDPTGGLIQTDVAGCDESRFRSWMRQIGRAGRKLDCRDRKS